MLQDNDLDNRFNKTMSIPSSSPTLLTTGQKRDRPLSSYFDSPTYSNGEENKIKHMKDTSPLVNRGPFRNISNFVFPNMRSKLSSSTKSLSRSMSSVAKASQQLLDNKAHSEVTNASSEEELDGINADSKGSPIQYRSNRSIRRIHSMCQTSKERENYLMQDNSHIDKTSINHFKVVSDLFPRIDESEMRKILNGDCNNDFDEFIIVDCRFNYEYEGGHIQGAINLMSQKDLEDHFLANPNIPEKKKQLLIFHCEFSSCRGPKLASHLRKCDRKLNSHNYPRLSYPDIVILAGGYKNFYDTNKTHCIPQGYVEMNDIKHQDICEYEMDKVRQANKLTRAKSYNHFVGDRPDFSSHMRSKSHSIIKSHIDNSKILKRHKSTTKVKPSSLLGSNSKLESKLVRAATFSNYQSVFNSPPSNPLVDEDFQPPFALFKSNHRKNSFHNSSSSISINSSTSSFCSESTCSSTDSLTDTCSSPIVEFGDFFESKSNNLTSYLKNHNQYVNEVKGSLLNPLTKKPTAPAPQLPRYAQGNASSYNINSISEDTSSNNSPNLAFKFPNSNPSKSMTSRNNLHRLNTSSRSNSLNSPLMHSPLAFTTPGSITDSNSTSNISAIFDPINDSPVDFAVPFPSRFYRPTHHSKNASGSFSSSGKILNSIYTDDESEEQDELRGKENFNVTKIKSGIPRNPFT